jgi:hypothetical protein
MATSAPPPVSRKPARPHLVTTRRHVLIALVAGVVFAPLHLPLLVHALMFGVAHLGHAASSRHRHD